MVRKKWFCMMAAIVAVSLGSETRPATQDDERWLETEWSEDSMT